MLAIYNYNLSNEPALTFLLKNTFSLSFILSYIYCCCCFCHFVQKERAVLRYECESVVYIYHPERLEC